MDYAEDRMTKRKNKTQLIKQALPHLKLRDIWLLESRFARPNTPEMGKTDLFQQEKRGAYFQTGTTTEDERDILLLYICVTLGIRLIDQPEADEPTVYFYIEADFMVEYELTGDVESEALKAFADLNAVHNVWPFWRQHVFDLVSRARLPKLDIPLFAGDME